MEETLISDDDNRIINIIAENPYVLTAKKVPGEFYPDLDYKNFTKVNINGIAFLPNSDFFAAYNLQNKGSFLMYSLIIDIFLSILYIPLNIWPMTIYSFLNLLGLYGIRYFDKKFLKIYNIIQYLSLILSIIFFIYISKEEVFNSIFISLFLLINKILVSINFYYFYNILPH